MCIVRVMEIGAAAALPVRLPESVAAYAEAPRDAAARLCRLAGLRLAAHLYEDAAGGPLPPLVFSERGKPSPQDGAWRFNISHAGSLVAAAVARDEVGIDLECYATMTKERAHRLLRFFSEEEHRRIASAPDPLRETVKTWVRKEALVKKSGEGLSALSRADSTLLPRYEEGPHDAEGREYYLCVY